MYGSALMVCKMVICVNICNLFIHFKLNSSSSSPNGDENFVENKALLDYSKLSENGEVIKPRSLAVSEFHFLLLIGDKVKV